MHETDGRALGARLAGGSTDRVWRGYRVRLPGRRVGTTAAEVAKLATIVRSQVRARGLRGVALGPIGVAVTATVAVWQHCGLAAGALAAWTAESAALPLTQAIVRLPGSLVAAVPQLPVWGALAQILVVLVLAQAALGVRRTLALTVLAQAVSSGAGRLMAHLGPHTFLGLSPAAASIRDTGPSAATVSVAVAVGLTCRTRRLTGLLVVAMVVASCLQPGLAAREHLVAIALGATWFLASRVWASGRQAVRRVGRRAASRSSHVALMG